MKESDAVKKFCPYLYASTNISAVLAMNSDNLVAINKDLKSLNKCTTSNCVMWITDQYIEEKIFDTHEEKPEGDGWTRRNRLPGSIGYTWSRYADADTGDCGLKQYATECNASCL